MQRQLIQLRLGMKASGRASVQCTVRKIGRRRLSSGLVVQRFSTQNMTGTIFGSIGKRIFGRQQYELF
jgi:hypothetical protein